MDERKFICPHCGAENDFDPTKDYGRCVKCNGYLTPESEAVYNDLEEKREQLKQFSSKFDDLKVQKEKMDNALEEYAIKKIEEEHGKKVFSKTSEVEGFQKLNINEELMVQYYDKFTDETITAFKIYQDSSDFSKSQTVPLLDLNGAKFLFFHLHKPNVDLTEFIFYGYKDDIEELIDEGGLKDNMAQMINTGKANIEVPQFCIRKKDLLAMCEADTLSIKRNNVVYEDKDNLLRTMARTFYNAVYDNSKYEEDVQKLLSKYKHEDRVATIGAIIFILIVLAAIVGIIYWIIGLFS